MNFSVGIHKIAYQPYLNHESAFLRVQKAQVAEVLRCNTTLTYLGPISREDGELYELLERNKKVFSTPLLLMSNASRAFADNCWCRQPVRPKRSDFWRNWTKRRFFQWHL